jgi:Lecithin:cholesterol acyltransferase
VIINRLLEAARRTGHVHRELARRARDTTRRPVIVVPSVLGVRLVDDRGRSAWGSTRRLFTGAGPAESQRATPAGVLDGFRLVPGLYRHDVFGGFLRYLEQIYGARLGEDLFALDYDWRRPLADAARALAELVARVRGASDDRVDLIAVSSGGQVVRTYLAGGWADDPAHALADPVLGAGPGAVHRVVYLGAPQRGNIAGFGYLQEGVAMCWGGQTFDARAMHTGCTALFDLLPHAGERIFVDQDGAALELDHLDVATWKMLGLVGHDRPGLAEDLARARANHALIAGAAARHPPAIAIADRHERTATQMVVDHGKLVVPCPSCGSDGARYPFAFGAGDGVVPAASMAAVPNGAADGVWWVETSAHHRIATDAHIPPLVVEALLAPLKEVPRERYAWPRNPQTRGVVPPEDSVDAR